MIDNLEEANKRLDWYTNKYGPYIEKRGMENFKNLFRWPTLQEWIILALLIMCIYFSIEGQVVTNWCNDYIANHTFSINLGGINNIKIINQSLNFSKLVINGGQG